FHRSKVEGVGQTCSYHVIRTLISVRERTEFHYGLCAMNDDVKVVILEYIDLAMLSYENIVKPNSSKFLIFIFWAWMTKHQIIARWSDYFEVVVSLERFDANGNKRKEVHFMEGLMSVGYGPGQIVRLDNAIKQPVINPFKGKYLLESVIFSGFRATLFSLDLDDILLTGLKIT
ncbi:F-box and associated interaction domains-containing protein, partial [Striga asiatica]